MNSNTTTMSATTRPVRPISRPVNRPRPRPNPRPDKQIYINRTNPRFITYNNDVPVVGRQCAINMLGRRSNSFVGRQELSNVINTCDATLPRFNYITRNNEGFVSREGFVDDNWLVNMLINLIIIVFLIVVLCWLFRMI